MRVDLGVDHTLGDLFSKVVLHGLETDSECSCDFLEVDYFVRSYVLLQIFVPDLGEDLLATEKHVIRKTLLNFVQTRGKLFESAIQEVVKNVPCFGVSLHQVKHVTFLHNILFDVKS